MKCVSCGKELWKALLNSDGVCTACEKSARFMSSIRLTFAEPSPPVSPIMQGALDSMIEKGFDDILEEVRKLRAKEDAKIIGKENESETSSNR